jgi:hypothetical protein
VAKLEKDYNDVIKKINAKIKEAGKLIEEAGNLGKKAGIEMLNIHPVLYEDGEYTDEQLEDLEEITYNIEFSPLLNAMDEVGWATSSLNC